MTKNGYVYLSIIALVMPIIVFLLLINRPNGFEIIQGSTGSDPPTEEVVAHTIERVYNCGIGGDTIYLTPSQSHSISESIQWEWGIEAKAERDLLLVDIGVALEEKYGKGYEESAQIGTGWQLPAREGEWVEYTIRWSEVWESGDIQLRNRNENREETVKYRYRKAIKTEIIDKQLLDCDTNTVMGATTVPPGGAPVSSFTSTITSPLTVTTAVYPTEAVSTPSPTKPFVPLPMPTAASPIQSATATFLPSPIVATSTAILTPYSPISLHVIASGIGWPSEKVTNPAQQRSTALLAAEMDAKRNLAEWLTGSNIEAVTIVEDGRVTVDWIRVEIRTHLKGTHIVSQMYDDSTGQATVEIVPDLAEQEP